MDTFTFGKYKGRKIDDICESDPKYVLWVNESIMSFELTQEQYNAAKQRIYEETAGYWERVEETRSVGGEVFGEGD